MNKKLLLLSLLLGVSTTYAYDKIQLTTGTYLQENISNMIEEKDQDSKLSKTHGLNYGINLLDLNYKPQDSNLEIAVKVNQENQPINQYPFVQYGNNENLKSFNKPQPVNTYIKLGWEGKNIPNYLPYASFDYHITGKDERKSNILVGLNIYRKNNDVINLEAKYKNKDITYPSSILLNTSYEYLQNKKFTSKTSLYGEYSLGFIGLPTAVRDFKDYVSLDNQKFLDGISDKLYVIDDFTYTRMSYSAPKKVSGGFVRLKNKIKRNNFMVGANENLKFNLANETLKPELNINVEDAYNLFKLNLTGNDIKNESSIWAMTYPVLLEMGNVSNDFSKQINSGGENPNNPPLKPAPTPIDEARQYADFIDSKLYGAINIITNSSQDQQKVYDELSKILKTKDTTKLNEDILKTIESLSSKEANKNGAKNIDEIKDEINDLLENDIKDKKEISDYISNITDASKLQDFYSILLISSLPTDTNLVEQLYGNKGKFTEEQKFNFIIQNVFGPRLNKFNLSVTTNNFSIKLTPKIEYKPMDNLTIDAKLGIDYLYKKTNFYLETSGVDQDSNTVGGEPSETHSAAYNKAFGGVGYFKWQFNMSLHKVDLKPDVNIKYNYKMNDKISLDFAGQVNGNISFVLNDSKPNSKPEGKIVQYGFDEKGNYVVTSEVNTPKIQSIPTETTNRIIDVINSSISTKRGLNIKQLSFTVKPYFGVNVNPIDHLTLSPYISGKLNMDFANKDNKVRFNPAYIQAGLNIKYVW